MTDRKLLQQALDALCDIIPANANRSEINRIQRGAITALRERLSHCDRCGKRMGGDGDIHTCTPPAAQRTEQELVEGYSSEWAKVTLMVSPKGEMHAIGGDQETGEGDMPYIGLDRIKDRLKATPPAQPAPVQEPDDSFDIDGQDAAYALEAFLQRADVIALLENLAEPEQEPAAQPSHDYDALYAAWLGVGADVKGLHWNDFVAKLKEKNSV